MAGTVQNAAIADDIQALFNELLGRSTTEEHIQSLIDSGASIMDVLRIITHSHEIVSRWIRNVYPETSLHAPATAGDIRTIFRMMLRREVTNDHIDSFLKHHSTIFDVMKIVLSSNEIIRSLLSSSNFFFPGDIDGHRYRIPDDLSVNKTEVRRVLLVGSCMMEGWRDTFIKLYPETQFDYLVFNNASALPEAGDDISNKYDFQILQIPIRSVLPEATYLQLKYSDEAAYEALFADACARLTRNLDAITAYNREHGLLSFISNFYTVQQNPIGRMQDRYSLKNMTHFFERLNQHLYEQTKRYKDVYVIDFDEIANMFGKKYVAEDLVFVISHGAVLVDIESRFDEARLEPLGSTTQIYGAQVEKYIQAAFEEARGMYRTLKQTDSVKLVIFDLDDTLWRGVAAEKDDVSPDSTEGWPIGLIEAVSYLWRRGIMLAIVSKNDIENVTRIWDALYGSRFSLDKFVMVAANWRPKAENIAEILAAVNLTPGSVLFVDDNPLERAAVKAAFPEIRVMDAPVVSWRRILLWSTETQRAVLTSEAIERTDMVQAQIKREDARGAMTNEDFLASLGLEIAAFEVGARTHKEFERCFELINKTNQFNTTGVRWSIANAQRLFDEGGYFLAMQVKDVYTNYGLTGVIVVEGSLIRQFVLSCRVFGMGVESAGIAVAQRHIRARGHQRVEGHVTATEKNKLSRAVFKNHGFSEEEGGRWHAAAAASTPIPPHIKLSDALPTAPDAVALDVSKCA